MQYFSCPEKNGKKLEKKVLVRYVCGLMEVLGHQEERIELQNVHFDKCKQKSKALCLNKLSSTHCALYFVNSLNSFFKR